MPVHVCNYQQNSTDTLKLIGTNMYIKQKSILKVAPQSENLSEGPIQQEILVTSVYLQEVGGFLEFQAVGFAADNQYLLYVRKSSHVPQTLPRLTLPHQTLVHPLRRHMPTNTP